MTDTDLWATAREWAERSGTVTSTLARLALDTRRALIGEQISEPTALAAAREDAEYRRAVADVLKAKHEGGDGAYWAEWHRDHCAAAQAADAARAEVADLKSQQPFRRVEELAAEVAELRDMLARVEALAEPQWHSNKGHEHENVGIAYAAGRNDFIDRLRAALGDADTLAERCPVSDAALGRCVLDAHDGDIHAWEGVAGPPGPPQRWQSSERADRIEGATDE